MAAPSACPITISSLTSSLLYSPCCGTLASLLLSNIPDVFSKALHQLLLLPRPLFSQIPVRLTYRSCQLLQEAYTLTILFKTKNPDHLPSTPNSLYCVFCFLFSTNLSPSNTCNNYLFFMFIAYCQYSPCWNINSMTRILVYILSA